MNIGDKQVDDDVPAAKRRLVDSDSSGNEKIVIDLTAVELESSPAPTGDPELADIVTIRGSSPLAYGSEGEEEEVRTQTLATCPFMTVPA